MAEWWRQLDFEVWQRLNVKRCRFFGWHKLGIHASPHREGNLFYQAVELVWAESASSRAFGIPTLVVVLYMKGKAQSRTDQARGLAQKVSKVDGVRLRWVRFYAVRGMVQSNGLRSLGWYTDLKVPTLCRTCRWTRSSGGTRWYLPIAPEYGSGTGFAEENVFVESEQTEDGESNQVFAGGTVIGGIKNHWRRIFSFEFVILEMK